jgi:hypothetical protein
MKFTIRDVIVVTLVVGLHFGLLPLLEWNLLVPPIVALAAAIGLSRSTRGILFSFWAGTLACLASAALIFVQVFLSPTDQGGAPWSLYWDVAICIIAGFGLVGSVIGVAVGFLARRFFGQAKRQG